MKNINDIKKEFPIFETNPNMVYLDSGATSQKPRCVNEAVEKFYDTENANPYRGAYNLSVKATKAYNDARHTVAEFINAKFDEEIIFTKNASEALNLVAYSYGMNNLEAGDEVVISIMEHHSNLVPWQKVTKSKNAVLRYMYINDDYEIDDIEIENKITEKTKIVGIVSVSNVLGTINNIEKIIKKAHSVGAVVLVDISQSVAHHKFDVVKTNVDFTAFSGHKMFAPLGIGVLYGKKELLEKMSPFLMGGDMIEYVYEQETTFAPLPHKFEAGTQNVGGAVGLASAINFIQEIGMENIEKYENDLISYAYEKLKSLPFLTLYCPSNTNHLSSVISFNINGIHPHDVASYLDANGICVRSGNHCAQPLMRFLNIDSTCRASFSIYNTKEDVDKLVEVLKFIYNKFKKYIDNAK